MDLAGTGYEDRLRMFARSNHHYVDQRQSVMGRQFLEGLRRENPDVYMRARILKKRVKVGEPIGTRVKL